MPLHLGLPHSDSHEAAREARKLLQTKVRNDWAFPALADVPESNHNDDLSGHEDLHNDPVTDAQQEAAALTFEPSDWKEREYSSCESFTSELSATEPIDVDQKKYKFDSPDLVGETIDEQKANRKRKRRQMLEDEMGWNAGLAHFVARRNAWTCAREVTDVNQNGYKEGVNGLRTPTSTSSPPVSSLSDSKTMLPIPPPLLPDHPVRARINTNSYSEIYSKIIIQARTPTVPINLAHIIRASVHGWKEEGNWPPKGTMPELPLGKKKNKSATDTNTDTPRHPHLRKGVQAVGRVLGLGISNGNSQTNGHKEHG